MSAMLSRTAFLHRNVAGSTIRRSFATSQLARADEPTPQSGHTASQKGFSKREKASEDQYIVEKEREQYRLAQQKLEKQKKDLDELEAKHAKK